MVRILFLLFFLLLIGCGSAPPYGTPVSGEGKVIDTSYIDSSMTLEYTNGQLVKYHLCAFDDNPVREGMTVNISFYWNRSKECFTVKDAYREKDTEDQ